VSQPVYAFAKRALDVAVAAAGLIVLSPIMLAVAAAITTGSPGPVFYRGRRVGRGGVPFDMYKFRTMVVDADRGASSSGSDDPRITPVGRLLRRWKLDELPQLINVVTGDMSLVGPRPQVQWAVDRYSPEERLVLTVRPGITDFASLRFHNEGEILKGSTDPDRDYMEKIHPEKMRLSLEYVRNQSLRTDVVVLARTAMAIFKH
jgi:lipopolysaccharide/colanic/teichoic acid biosynthesis glycosyltransferase